MLGVVQEIIDNKIIIKKEINIVYPNDLINRYVLVNDEKHKLIGEIITDNKTEIHAQLIGEIIDQNFVYGIIQKPALLSTVSLLTKEGTSFILSNNKNLENKSLYVGKSSFYPDINIYLNISNFFSNHFAILGSTGSGKSSGFARLIQNLFYNKQYIAYYSNFFIFDAYGEYHSAFQSIKEENPNISFKSYTTNFNLNNSEILRIPLWLLDVDDLALLLRVDKSYQIPILEKALKLVNIFKRNDEEVIQYKNDILARAIIDILSSGNNSSQIRDQIISILSIYYTKDLNLETKIIQPGYTRSLKQCLLIDSLGKMREMELIMNFIQQYVKDNLDETIPQNIITYNLEDLEKALNFALISEGILKSDKVYDDSNILKVRLHSLVNSSYSEYFKYDEYVSKEEYIRRLLITNDGKKAQIINFNLNSVDDYFSKTITKIYAKLLFNYAKNNNERAKMAFHLILEEAHRYVQEDQDFYLLGYNIFERITKEGRKYGVLLGIISQRPCEISTTVISQCSNFLVFKTIHPIDVEYIYKMLPCVTIDIVERLKTLQPGNCIAFGNAFCLPTMIKMEMPKPAPNSSNCDISKIWFIDTKNYNNND